MNRKLYTLSILFFILLQLKTEHTSACGFDFTGTCSTTARFSVNNVPTEYLIAPCSFGAQFPSSLGSGITQLQLTDASTRTWESCINNVMQSALFYRIYKDSLNKGAFNRVDLTQLSLFNSPPYRTKTYSGSPNTDLLQGLLANTAYTIEIFHQVFVDTDGNNVVDSSAVSNNGGAYFKSSFQTGNISGVVGFPINGSATNNNCNGGNNGSATATPASGTGPYTFLWSNNATTASISGLKAGNYTVTVTDKTNAIGTRSFIISEPAAIGATITNANPSCGQTNGAISAAALGGTAPYSYVWNTGATTPSVSSLAQGTYNVTVKDVNNCTGSVSTTLIENCGNTNTYCASKADAPWNEWVGRVQLNTLDNASEKTRSDRFVVGYSDWKDKSTPLTKGVSYPLSITPALSWSGYQTNLFYRVWIDFNKNGVFEDNEKVFEANKTGLSIASGTIAVPASALLGATVMRVSLKKDAYPTACETFAAGEVEDYSLIIKVSSGNPCANDATPPTLSTCPQNIVLTTAGTSAIITWAAPTATDNCTANPTISSNFTSGQSFSIGNKTVIYTAKDSSNNTATCSFTVSVSKILATPMVVLKNATHSVQKSQKICTSVTVDSFSNIISAQWVSLFDPSVLRFDSLVNLNATLGLTKGGNFGTTFASAGEIRFVWAGSMAKSLVNGEKLYDMCFTAIGNGGASSAIRIDSARGTVVEIANDLGQLRAVVAQAGTVSVIDTAGQSVCKRYPVKNTNEVCQQTWKPYGMKLTLGNTVANYVAQSVVFETTGTTAVLRGTMRSNTWAAIVVNINLTGGTTVAPSGSPATTTCGGNGTGYTYFTVMSGTVQINGQTLTIARRGASFQYGTGANLQNATEFGASGQFILSDGTGGEFGFQLGTAASCTNSETLAFFSDNKTMAEYKAYQDNDQIQLVGGNNISFRKDYPIETQAKLIGVIYPNPAKNNVYLGLNDSSNNELKILIYNTLGIVEKQFMVLNTPNVPIELDVENLRAGHYFMRIIVPGYPDMVKPFVIGQ
jgi:GEVED domain/HYR domain/SprB repeat/Secretion system C-terminal sorting domain